MGVGDRKTGREETDRKRKREKEKEGEKARNRESERAREVDRDRQKNTCMTHPAAPNPTPHQHAVTSVVGGETNKKGDGLGVAS